jgi:hypothetical protein
MNRELIAPDAPADRDSPLVSTTIRAGSWPPHGCSYLPSIVRPAGRFSAATPAAALAARAGSPARGHPARRASDRTPRAAGLFRGGTLAARPGSRTGTFRGQPARAARRRVPGRWREGHRSPSHPYQRVKNRDNRALLAARLSTRVVSLASAGGPDVWLSCSAAPANSHQTVRHPRRPALAVGLGEPFREPSVADAERRRATRPDNSSS